MKWVKTLLWMIIFIFAFFFLIQNGEDVTLRFGLYLYPIITSQWFEQRIPLSLALFSFLFVGTLLGGSTGFYTRRQLRKTLRQNQKTIQGLEEEIHALRSPVLDQSPFGKKDI